MLQELIERFSEVTELPIEIYDIAKCITEMGVQDEIYFFPIETDTRKIRGACHRFTYQKSVYGDPNFVTHIVYSKNETARFQRVIAVKEMIHIFDDNLAITDTADEVSNLLDKLAGPLSSEDYGLADIQAAKDRLALYQSLPLLLPRAALDKARQEFSSGSKSPEDIAEWACMPVEFVKLMLSDVWVGINGAIEGI